MDSQSDVETSVNEIQQTIGELNLTSGVDCSAKSYTIEVRRNLNNLIKTISSQLDILKSISEKMSAPVPKRGSVGTKKPKSEPQLTRSIIRDECCSLVSGLNSFTIPNLKTAMKNRFDHKGFLRTDLENPEQLGITPEEYEIHKLAISDESLQVYAITDKDIPTLVKRIFKSPEVYSITTKTGKTIQLDVASFVGKSRQDIMTVLENARWCEHRFDLVGSRLLLSEYILEIFAQVPVLKPYDILSNQEVYKTNEGFMKLLDLIRDTHELYFPYSETHESRILLDQLGVPLINNYFKLDVVGAVAKAKKYTQSPKEIESIKRTLMGISDTNSLLIQ